MTPSKLSRYVTISSRSYEDALGQRVKLVYNGKNGALLSIPEAQAVLLKEGWSPTDNVVFNDLCEAGALVPDDEDELTTILERNSRAALDGSTRSFVLLPSSYCNMGCSYCGQTHKRGTLPPAWERLTTARIAAVLRDPATRAVHVGWFGGEPMAGYQTIIRVSAALTPTADEFQVRYDASMTTNGSLLSIPKLVELHGVARLRRIEVTIDGPEVVHNRRRSLLKGGGSFRHIVDTLLSALGMAELRDLTIRIRTNIDVRNAEHVTGYLLEMKRLGFDHERVAFDLSPVYQWSNDVSEVEISKREFAALEIDWMVLMLELGLRFTVLPSHSTDVVCTAATRYAEVISPSGSIFSCTEHPLVPQHEAGDALTTLDAIFDGRRPLGSFDDWNKLVERGDVPCQGCAVFGVCGGACPKHWTEKIIPCPSFKLNLQERFDVAATARRLRIV